MDPHLLLCSFLLTCFDKPLDDNLCAKGCTCYKEPNDEISAICESRSKSIDSEFPFKTMSSLAFTNNVFPIKFEKLFPAKRTVQNLIIYNSRSNLWSTDENNLFQHIEKTQFINFINVFFMGWKWEKLAINLLTVEGIYCEECHFENNVIPAMISRISTQSVILLSIIKCDFNNIEDRALDWPNLRKITISGNKIPKLNRVWFPIYMNDLWSLDLRYNKIEDIPKGFFNGMPKLKKLQLSENLIKTLIWETFKPVWDHLDEFWIAGNLIDCSRDLVWITNMKQYPLFFGDGFCRHSGHQSHEIMLFYRANSAIDVDRLAQLQ